jgi:hypothetical protein
MAIAKQPPKSPAAPDAGMTQRVRWLRFGSNVAVMILLATALVVAVVWLSAALLRGRLRSDWTAGGRFSLSPRTKALLGGLADDPRDAQIRLTNLYSYSPEIPGSQEKWQRVHDLLSEYDVASTRVEVEHIDPTVDVGGVERLIQRLTDRYAGQLVKPRQLVEQFKVLDQDVKDALQAQADRLDAAADAWKDGPAEAVGTLRMVAQVWRQLVMVGEVAAGEVDYYASQALPAYEPALSRARDYLGQVRDRFEVVPEALKQVQDQAGEAEIPPAVREILDGAAETYSPLAERIRKFTGEASKVEEIEFDTIRRQITQGDTVLIETSAMKGVIEVPAGADADVEKVATGAGAESVGPKRREGEAPAAEPAVTEIVTPSAKFEAVRKALEEAKVEVADARLERRPADIQVLAYSDVWVWNPAAGEDPNAPERLFAGEQAVSSALLGMVRKEKPALLFVTAGGPATRSMPGPMGRGQQALYEEMAERLRRANFIVQDWNVQAERELPEIQDASKIVLVFVPPPPSDPRMPIPPPGPEAYQAAVDLVKAGAPAILLGEPGSIFQQPVPYGDLFGNFGVDAKFNAVAVRNVPAGPGDREQAVPYLVLTDYPAHEITKPIGGLPLLLLGASPLVIQKDLAEGLAVKPLVEMPASRDYWADTVVMEALNGRATRDDAEDLPGPLPLAVAVTKTSDNGQAQKVVLFGDTDFARDTWAFRRETVLYADGVRQRIQFPGNAELFVNACLWVSGGEQLIAVSPEALEARRLGDMGGWKLPLQVFLIGGLPLLVLAAGILVYAIRRRS